MSRNRDIGSGPVTVKTAPGTLTLAANWQADLYLVDTSTSVCTVTLDPNAVDGDQFIVKDATNNAGTNNITINSAAPVTGILDHGTSLVVSVSKQAVQFYFSGALNKWVAVVWPGATN